MYLITKRNSQQFRIARGFYQLEAAGRNLRVKPALSQSGEKSEVRSENRNSTIVPSGAAQNPMLALTRHTHPVHRKWDCCPILLGLFFDDNSHAAIKLR
jgi:hypothetical protein